MLPLVEGKYTVPALVAEAEKIVRKKTSGSELGLLLSTTTAATTTPNDNNNKSNEQLQDTVDGLESIPKFGKSELKLGRVLGRGGFSVLYEITALKRKLASDMESANANDTHDGPRVTLALCHNAKRGQNYVLKRLKPEHPKNAQDFVQAVIDLYMEAHFLSVLNHPHILQLQGIVVDTCPQSLILEKLVEVFDKRLKTWKRTEPSKFFDRRGVKARAHWEERIRVATHISSALAYLHDARIVFRDLKPDNVGFDMCGNVKLFDFGLAKELSLADRDADGMYLLTAETGSPRYMDPVIVGFGKTSGKKEMYNEGVDVYSFCIFLWQILALETPFACYQTWSSFQKKVIMGGKRPKCPNTWPSSLCSMLRNGWGDIRHRLPMKSVTNELKRQLGESVDTVPEKARDDKASVCTTTTSVSESAEDEPLEILLQKIGLDENYDDDTSSDAGTSDEDPIFSSKDMARDHQPSSANQRETTSLLDQVLGVCCCCCCPTTA